MSAMKVYFSGFNIAFVKIFVPFLLELSDRNEQCFAVSCAASIEELGNQNSRNRFRQTKEFSAFSFSWLLFCLFIFTLFVSLSLGLCHRGRLFLYIIKLVIKLELAYWICSKIDPRRLFLLVSNFYQQNQRWL